MGTEPGDITELLARARSGDPNATSTLMERIYGELHRLAVYYMRSERSDHSLQPTALVNEAYEHLFAGGGVDWHNRQHFLAVAAQVMRRVLIDHARGHRAAKRGGAQTRVDLEDAALFTPARSEELIALDEALTRLAAWDPRQSRIVELRFFGGLTDEETAEVLNVSVRTVKRDWAIAKAWLYAELTKGNARVAGAMGPD
jgi:RNA polymerase sigma-70 factor (ECF subfamily)